MKIDIPELLLHLDGRRSRTVAGGTKKSGRQSENLARALRFDCTVWRGRALGCTDSERRAAAGDAKADCPRRKRRKDGRLVSGGFCRPLVHGRLGVTHRPWLPRSFRESGGGLRSMTTKEQPSPDGLRRDHCVDPVQPGREKAVRCRTSNSIIGPSENLACLKWPEISRDSPDRQFRKESVIGRSILHGRRNKGEAADTVRSVIRKVAARRIAISDSILVSSILPADAAVEFIANAP